MKAFKDDEEELKNKIKKVIFILNFSNN